MRFTQRGGLVKACKKTPCWLSFDFSNAFNTLRRDIMLEAVARCIRELYAMAFANYSQATQLKSNDYIIMSAEGPQQGDPLSALLFCLALQSLIRELASSLGVGYLHGVTLEGAPLIIASDVELIQDKAKQYGLTLNISKCELIAENQQNSLISRLSKTSG